MLNACSQYLRNGDGVPMDIALMLANAAIVAVALTNIGELDNPVHASIRTDHSSATLDMGMDRLTIVG